MDQAVSERCTRRILLVEDDRELRDALAEALEEEGHEVIAVGDGKEALREMRSQRPDVVVLDLMMPVMDGWQFRVIPVSTPRPSSRYRRARAPLQPRWTQTSTFANPWIRSPSCVPSRTCSPREPD